MKSEGADRFSRYGGRYWHVSSRIGELWLHAEKAEIQSGALVFLNPAGSMLFGFAPGTWTAFHAASLINGTSINVEYWDDPEIPPSWRPRLKISPSLRHKVFQRDGRKCRICGKSGDEIELTVDHVKPQSKGGTNKIGNLQTLCVICNAGKGCRS